MQLDALHSGVCGHIICLTLYYLYCMQQIVVFKLLLLSRVEQHGQESQLYFYFMSLAFLSLHCNYF
jgi:hypothetical protein